MKKILLCALFLSFFQAAYAEETLHQYTIIKTTHNYAPIREEADVNAKRFSHLKKGTTIFADEVLEDFFRVDLGLDKYYWIEKKYVDVDSTAETKETPVINKIKLSEDDKFYKVKIKTPVITPYNEIETSANSLDFILYDVILDKKNLNISGKTDADFKVSKDKFGNLKISYSSNFPLTGHEVTALNNGLLLKVKKPFEISEKNPLKNITVVIDPGHGGEDPGAVSFNMKEKDLNFQISNILKDKLAEKGAKVYLTREEDIDVDLYERIDFAKEKEADFLISIHQNSLPNPKNVDKKHGVGVYYYNKEAYSLASEIQKSLVEGTGFTDDGVNFASFALTRAQNPICILVECGYIIHEEEAKKLSDPSFQKLLSDYLIKGLENYLINNF